MKALLLKIKNSMAAIALVGAFLWSALFIFTTREKEYPPGAIVLRIGHWQLEPGFRDALYEIIRDYEALHPNVRIVVDNIPESIYGQWITTQLMGSTAPDIIEIGMGLPGPTWINYMSRYFTPLSDIAGQPNPYNKGTDLEGKPYRSTFKDGLLGGYVEELQEVMKVPICQHTTRLFYNKDLLKKLTGLDKPPSDYREFLAVCDKIRAQKDANGLSYVPIAGYFTSWESRLFQILTYPAVLKADLSRDGRTSVDETFLAFRAGVLDFDFEPFEKRMKMMWEVSEYLPAGYTGMKRDEGVFKFIQQQAVFISTGTWDAGSLLSQAKGAFELGVADYPRPAKDDPFYGDTLANPIADGSAVMAYFGVNRASKYEDVAVDFLLFLTSQKINEKFNRRVNWMPAVVGAKSVEFIKPFEPNYAGLYAGIDNFVYMSGATQVRWQQDYSNFQAINREQKDEQGNKIPSEKLYKEGLAKFKKSYTAFYLEKGKADFDEFLRNQRRSSFNHDQLSAGIRARALTLDGADSEGLLKKYRGFLRGRLLMLDYSVASKAALAEKKLPYVIPYEYTPEALARMKEDARKAAGQPADPQPSPADTSNRANE